MNDIMIKLVDMDYGVVNGPGDGDPILQYELEEMPEEENLVGWQVTVRGGCRKRGIFEAVIRFVVMADREEMRQNAADRGQIIAMALDRIGCKCSYLLAGMLRETYEDLLIVPPMMEEGIDWPEEDGMEYDPGDYDDFNEDAEEPDSNVVHFKKPEKD